MFVRTFTPATVRSATLDQLTRAMDAQFAAALGSPCSVPASRPSVRTGIPPIDVSEHADRYEVVADVPGLTLDQVAVEFDENTLILRRATVASQTTPAAETAAQNQPEVASTPETTELLRRERPVFDQFQRSIRFAERIEADRISATLNLGVLTVTLPKQAPAQPKRISVKTTQN